MDSADSPSTVGPKNNFLSQPFASRQGVETGESGNGTGKVYHNNYMLGRTFLLGLTVIFL